MPHLIVEFTDNLQPDGDIAGLLPKLTRVLIDQGAYPIGGIRARAIELHHYRIADGQADDAFVHATLKIGAGRSDAVKQATCDGLFAAMKDHFADLFARRYLALSLELVEFSEAGTWKHNNIHQRFKTP